MKIYEVPSFDMTIYAGADYHLDVVYSEDDIHPVDMSGWSVEATLRKFAEHNRGTEFRCSADANGIHLHMTADQTAAQDFIYGVYDVFVTDPDNNLRVKFIEGRAYVEKNVIR